VRALLAAVAFLTRIPVPGAASIGASDVARSAGWFPLVGLLLGSIYALAAVLLKTHLPAGIVAVVVVLLDALCTGALHFDGLADTADGLGGGKNKEDVLRIMRDHAIGSYGGVALVLAIAFKITALAALMGQQHWITGLILTPALGRWSMLLLAANLPYAGTVATLPQRMGSVIDGMNGRSLLWGSVVVLLSLAAAGMLARAWIALGAVSVTTLAFGLFCRKRLGGITGDILGANLQLCEIAVLLAFVWS